MRPEFSPTASISPEAVEDAPLTEDEELQKKKSDSDGADVLKAVTAVTADETADGTAVETTSISRPGLRTFAIQPTNIMGKCMNCTAIFERALRLAKLAIHKNRCCYITVDFATTALQNGAYPYRCISKQMHKTPLSHNGYTKSQELYENYITLVCLRKKTNFLTILY